MPAEKAWPIPDAIQLWLYKQSTQTPPKGLFGKVISYALNQRGRLLVYLGVPTVTPDNNLAGNDIRPLVLGRENWLFAGKPRADEARSLL